jgi:photosystem II stability/assembly factor-like uncharacterized protein
VRHAPAFLALTGDYRRAVPFVASTRGWRALPRPRVPIFYDTGAVDFTDTTHGLITAGSGEMDDPRVPVYSTEDGGRTWSAVRLPASVAKDDDVAISSRAVVIRIGRDGVQRGVTSFVTVDRGRRWQAFASYPGYDTCGVSQPSAAAIWVTCARSAYRSGATTILVTANGGHTWTRLRTTRIELDTHLVALSETEAWDVDSPTTGRSTALWHTVDGGRTWQQIRLRVPPFSRVGELQCSDPCAPWMAAR